MQMIKTGKRRFLKVLMLMVLMVPVSAWAQLDYGSQDDQYNQMNPDGSVNRRNSNMADSLGTDKEIPRGIKVWTVDSRFGDRRSAEVDTVSHMYMATSVRRASTASSSTVLMPASSSSRSLMTMWLRQSTSFTSPTLSRRSLIFRITRLVTALMERTIS